MLPIHLNGRSLRYVHSNFVRFNPLAKKTPFASEHFQYIYPGKHSEAIPRHDAANPSEREIAALRTLRFFVRFNPLAKKTPFASEHFQYIYPGKHSEAISQHDAANPSNLEIAALRVFQFSFASIRSRKKTPFASEHYQYVYLSKHSEAISRHDTTNPSEREIAALRTLRFSFASIRSRKKLPLRAS